MANNGKDLGPTMSEEEKRAAEEKRVADLRAQGLNPDGSPIQKEFDSLIDPKTGRLKDTYQLRARDAVTVDQRAIDEIRNRALEKGPSAWAKMALDRQKLEEMNALDMGAKRAAGAQAQATNNLMMNGGLNSGARERMASSMTRDKLLAANQMAREGQMDRSKIGLDDQNLKDAYLKMVPQLDFQNADIAMKNRDYETNIDRANIGAALSENQAKRDYDMGIYKEGMQKWAAGKQADAQAKASGGGK